jgi:hypothetical protein
VAKRHSHSHPDYLSSSKSVILGFQILPPTCYELLKLSTTFRLCFSGFVCISMMNSNLVRSPRYPLLAHVCLNCKDDNHVLVSGVYYVNVCYVHQALHLHLDILPMLDYTSQQSFRPYSTHPIRQEHVASRQSYPRSPYHTTVELHE